MASYDDLVEELQLCEISFQNSAQTIGQLKELVLQSSRQPIWKDINYPGGGTSGIWTKLCGLHQTINERKKKVEDLLHIVRDAQTSDTHNDRSPPVGGYLPPHRARTSNFVVSQGSDLTDFIGVGINDLQNLQNWTPSAATQTGLGNIEDSDGVPGESLPRPFSMSIPPSELPNKTMLNPNAPSFVPPSPRNETPYFATVQSQQQNSHVLVNLDATVDEPVDEEMGSFYADLQELVDVETPSSEVTESLNFVRPVNQGSISGFNVQGAKLGRS